MAVRVASVIVAAVSAIAVVFAVAVTAAAAVVVDAGFAVDAAAESAVAGAEMGAVASVLWAAFAGKAASGAPVAWIVSAALAAYTVVLGDSAWDVLHSGIGRPAGLAVVESQLGCKRADWACKHSWAVAVALAKGTAEEELGSNFDGYGLGADPAVNSVATSGEVAVVKVRGAGSRLVWAAKQRV